MSTPTIPNGEEHFFPVIYSGNGQGQRVGKFVPFTDNGTIDNSVIFNHSDTTMQLQLPAPASAGNQKTFTFSCWFKRAKLGDQSYLYSVWDGTDDGSPYLDDRHYAQWRTDNTLYINFWGDGVMTNRTFEDTSKWYHYLLAVDSTQSTAADRIKLYIDGDLVTSFSSTSYFAQDSNLAFPKRAFTIGNTKAGDNAQEPFDGYIAEFNAIEGQALTPSTFGLTDTSTGRWIPKTLSGITYGTNGFRLKFQDSSALGDDTSGNGHDFSNTGLVASDQRTDTPTNNLPIMRPYNPSYSQVLSEGSLSTNTNGSNKGYAMCSTLRPKGSGKYYAEVRTSGNGGGGTLAFGCYTQEDLHGVTTSGNVYVGHTGSNGCGSGFWYVHGGTKELRFGATTTSNPTVTVNGGDVIGIALDLDNDKISFYDNSGSLIGSTTFDSSKSACFAAMSNMSITFIWNFGDNGTFAGYETAGGNADEDGNGNFFHSVPAGFKMLTKENMPEPAKGVPGLTWTKDVDASVSWMCIDSSRTYAAENVPAALNLNNTNKEYGQVDFVDGINKFLKGGYALVTRDNSNSYMNKAGNLNVSYSWVANSGTTSSITTGTINTVVQANTTAGFSIVKYTGIGTSGTGYHGLSAAPEFMIFKDRENDSTNWRCWHHKFGNITTYLKLNSDDSYSSASMWGTPTSDAFILGGSGYEVNESGRDYIAYLWHGVDGFSKFGSYVGNSSTDGTFVYLGFRPAFVMIKAYNLGVSWYIFDSKRDPINPAGKRIVTDGTYAQDAGTTETLDFLSNGFKLRNTSNGTNGGYTYLYHAWAENPFVGDGTNPVTAR